MQIPSLVQVGAMQYEVRIIPNMHADRELYGEVLYGQQIIKIAGDISESRQINVFLHELTHAILFESGGEDYQDELLVRRFSNVLTQVVFANKWKIGEEDKQDATSEHETV